MGEKNVWKIELNLRGPEGSRMRMSSRKPDGTVVRTDMPYDHPEDIEENVKFHRQMAATQLPLDINGAHQLAQAAANSQSGK